MQKGFEAAQVLAAYFGCTFYFNGDNPCFPVEDKVYFDTV